MTHHEWYMFLLGVVFANQLWLSAFFLFVAPKIRKLREAVEKYDAQQ